MIVEMGEYAWSGHIVTVFLVCQITIKNVQVQLSQTKNNPRKLHPHPTDQKYRDNVPAPRVLPQFDNHALADGPMFMDDNAMSHRTRIVQHFLQQEAVQTIPWHDRR
jgi:hypothetical protein